MKRAVVCGAGGFIGSHLVKRLKREGYWVRGVDIKEPEFSKTLADDFGLLDLREEKNCQSALTLPDGGVPEEVYQLAADMGGMGFIHSAECEIMHNSVLINVHMTDAAAKMGVKAYFYSSSACVYRDMKPGEPEMRESEAVPANPDNEYGWEKLYSERIVEIWGDGSAVRSYTYVDDMVDGIFRLMHSNLEGAVNIGCPQYVTVKELVDTVALVAGKNIKIKPVAGPVGVQSRNFGNDRIYSIGWRSQFDLKSGIQLTYPWVTRQFAAAS